MHACIQCVTCHKYLFSGVDGGKAILLDDKLYCRKHAELVSQRREQHTHIMLVKSLCDLALYSTAVVNR
jgi:hypothetical protein